jgi:hypothetical protein
MFTNCNAVRNIRGMVCGIVSNKFVPCSELPIIDVFVTKKE